MVTNPFPEQPFLPLIITEAAQRPDRVVFAEDNPSSHSLRPQGRSCRSLADLPYGCPDSPAICAAVFESRKQTAVHEASNHKAGQSEPDVSAHDAPDPICALRDEVWHPPLTFPVGPKSKAHNKKIRAPRTHTGTPRAPVLPPEEAADFSASAATRPRASLGTSAVHCTADWFTSFDVLQQDVIIDRDPGWDPDRCVREAVTRSIVPNPFGRLLFSQVAEYPGPQVAVQSFRTYRTHRAIVVVSDSCHPRLQVWDYPLGLPFRSFLFSMTVERRHPWQEHVMTLSSMTCTVNDRLLSCEQPLPVDADTVRLNFVHLPEDGISAQLPDTLPIVGLPLPDASHAAASSHPTAEAPEHSARHRALRPYAVGDARPPVPPIPGSPGRRWGTSEVQRVHASTLRRQQMLPLHVIADCTHAFNGAGDDFVLFDEYLHMRILPLPPCATAHQVVQMAYDHTAQLPHPRSHRFLHHAIPGLPAVQLCVWGQLSIDDRVLPFLTQDARLPVCTVRVSKEGSAFDAALAVEEACGFGDFLHLGLQSRQIHMACNSRPIQPHTRWALQHADYAGFSIGPVPGQSAPVPNTRWAQSAPMAIPIIGRQDITDGDPINTVIAHRHGQLPVSFEMPHASRHRRMSSAISTALGSYCNGERYQVHLPLVMPLCQGTPLYCVALSGDHPRPANAVILDMRRILCPPTAPFITVEAPAIISFPAVVHGIQSMGVRHWPITAAYINDELIGASSSVTGPVSVITFLSHWQTRGTSENAAVCVLDGLSEASNRSAAQVPPTDSPDCSAASHEAGALCTSTSTTTTSISRDRSWEPHEEPQPAARTRGSGRVALPGPQRPEVRGVTSFPVTQGQPVVFQPFGPPVPLHQYVPTHAFPSSAGLGAGVTAPPPGQHFSAWTLWDEAEFDSLAGPRTPAASGSGHGAGAGSYSSPRNHTVGASTEETTESQMPPPGQHFSPWSLWNEAEEQAWDQRPRAAQRVDEVDEVDEEANAPPWNVRRCAAGTASTGSGHSPDAIDPAGLPLSISFNPALPAGWPAGHSFAHHCHVLNTLDPRVLPNSFTLFDVALQVRIIPKPRRAGEVELRDLARQHCRHLVPPIYIHLLEDEVPGFPSPQFTAFAGASPLQAFAVPLDLRPAGWGVCVAPVRNRASLSTIVSHARTVCPVSNFQQKVARRTLTATSKGRALHPFTPLPVDTDHVRFQRASGLDAENSATTDSISDVIAQAAIDRELDDRTLG